MHIQPFVEIPHHQLPGLDHQTLAGPAQGLRTLEVWHQILEPGAETPEHRHACEEVVVVLRGSGCCDLQGRSVPFAAPAALIVPADVVHRIRNTGEAQMVVVAALGMAPVVVQTADGAPIPLPWG